MALAHMRAQMEQVVEADVEAVQVSVLAHIMTLSDCHFPDTLTGLV